jgi:hypothetical protein
LHAVQDGVKFAVGRGCGDVLDQGVMNFVGVDAKALDHVLKRHCEILSGKAVVEGKKFTPNTRTYPHLARVTQSTVSRQFAP